MNLIATAKMGPGTFEAKFLPLSKLDCVEKIYILREEEGPDIEKLKYIILPSYIKRNKFLKLLVPLFLAKYTKKYNCDLIIGYHIIPHAFYAFFASLITNVPFACAQTGLIIQKFSSKFGFKKILRLVFHKALFFNVPGKKSKEFWTNFGVDPKKINLLHSTIDVNRFYNTKLKKSYDFIILSRLSEEKRIEKLLFIFAQLKKENRAFTVAIVGDGPKKKYLETLTQNYNITDHISFVGFVKDPEIWFNKAKCFLLASESEGFPTALMQAMACELIPISTNVGNISDTIKNGVNGYLVDYGDWELYKRLLIQILDKPENTNIPYSARESIIKNHSFEFAIEMWKQVFYNNALIR